MYYSLCCPPGTILCFFVCFLSLFLLSNIYSPHAPTLKCANALWLGLLRKSPQKGGSWHLALVTSQETSGAFFFYFFWWGDLNNTTSPNSISHPAQNPEPRCEVDHQPLSLSLSSLFVHYSCSLSVSLSGPEKFSNKKDHGHLFYTRNG